MKVKKIISILLVLSMLFMLVACGGAGEVAKTEEPAAETPAEPVTAEEPPAEAATTETGGTLELYVSHKEDVYSPIVVKFQDKYNIKVNVVAAGTGEILKRVEAESVNPMGDVVFGGGAESLEAYKEYFENYKTTEDSAINSAFKSSDDAWTPFSALPIILMYNTDLVGEADAPKTWDDLLDPKWKGQIAFTDPALSGSCFTAMVTMIKAKETEEAGWDFIKSLVENLDGKLLKSSSDIFKGVADGEFAIGVTLEESAYKYMLADAPVSLTYPSDGTSVVPDGTAIIKGGKNLENAKLFIDFVSSQEIQNFIVSDMSRRSVRDDVSPSEGLPAVTEIALVDYSISEVSQKKDDIMNTWKNILIGK